MRKLFLLLAILLSGLIHSQQIDREANFFGAKYFERETGNEISRKEAKQIMMKNESELFSSKVQRKYNWSEIGRWSSNIGVFVISANIIAEIAGNSQPAWTYGVANIAILAGLPIKWINLRSFKNKILEHNDMQQENSKVALELAPTTNGIGLRLRF